MNTMLAEILREQNPYVAVQLLVGSLEQGANIECPAVYFISTLENCYVRISSKFGKKTLPIEFPMLEPCIVQSERDGCILAFIIAEKKVSLREDTDKILQGMLLHFFDRCFAADYFEQVKKPIDFTNYDTYYEETAELLSMALGMPMVAIRRLNADGDLESLCFFDVESSPGSMQDFLAEDIPPPFEEVLKTTGTLIEADKLEDIRPAYHCDIDLTDPRYEFLTRNNVLNQVKTFIIFPIVYGHELFGIMSCASRCRHVFSDLQKYAVGGLMQIIGVAISNFLRYHEAQELHLFRTEQIVDTTAVEVAKSTKHELSNAQAEVSTMLLGLKHAIKGNQPKKMQSALQLLEESVDNLLPSIQKLSFGDKSDRKLEQTSIRAIWDMVIMLFSERLKRMGIEAHYQGSDCHGDFYVEMMKDAFLNLMLNSIDAFKMQKKRGRKITLATSLISGGERCQIDYSDNAGGPIQSRSSYRVPGTKSMAHSDTPIEELIFLPKVSSKEGLGSGWGLYLVRRAIDIHKGSINLVNARNGCTFRIDIPRLAEKQ